MYRVILFDLDGTLTDSGEGITRSVQYAIEKLGREKPDLEELKCFVGPPLMEQFMSYCNITREEAKQCVENYRERYGLIGLYENKPYDGIRELLEELRNRGFILGVASSKPEYYVEKILEYFDLYKYFHAVVGSQMDGSRTGKAAVVEEALVRLNMQNHRNQVLLVGDREHDVLGARSAGVDCAAVTYGYGSWEELNKVHPVAIVSTVAQLQDFLASGSPQNDNVFKKIWRILYPPLIYWVLMSVISMGLMIPAMLIGGEKLGMMSAVWATGISAVIMIPLAIWLRYLDEKKGYFYTQEKGKIGIPGVIWMLALGASLSYVLNVLLGILNIFKIFPSYDEGVGAILYSNPFLVTLLCAGILAPIAEEYLFRELVYERLKNYVGTGVAILLSALFFGVYHGNMVQFIYATILGIVFAYLKEYFGTLLVPIVLHISANVWSVLLSYFGEEMGKIGHGIPMTALLLLQFLIIIVSAMDIAKKRPKDAKR